MTASGSGPARPATRSTPRSWPPAAGARRSTGRCGSCRRPAPTRSGSATREIPRRVSGYNLDSLLPEHGFDVARALVGSESTLVTILHAELRLVPAPAAQALVVLGYPDIASAADAVPRIAPHQPSSWRASTTG